MVLVLGSLVFWIELAMMLFFWLNWMSENQGNLWV